MSDGSTIRMIEEFRSRAKAPMFLSSLFRLTERNIHTSEKVEIDSLRDEEEIAVPLPSVTTGPRYNEATKFSNKAFEPPIFDEAGGINAFALLRRGLGQNPFEDRSFARKAGEEAIRVVDACGNKVRRANELMSAQVLQTGIISLVDKNGAVVWTCDFGMKSSHKITVATAWAVDGTTGNPVIDISNAANIVRRDSRTNADQLLFGKSAIQRFVANAQVQKLLDKQVLNLGQLNMSKPDEDATYYGKIWLANYQYDLWAYNHEYKHPQTGTMTPYIGDDNVIVNSSKARKDMTFGMLPMFLPADTRALSFLPERIVLLDRGIALTTNAWVTADGKHLFVSAGGRPLPIPTDPDGYACIDVTP
jgi:hypothetical protein